MERIIRKLIVVLIIISPAISYSGCKKQDKCGCGNDVQITLTNEPANVYFLSSANITITVPRYLGSTFNLCNPTEIFPKLEDIKTGDQVLVSGLAYWDCTYVYQQSNYSYNSMYRVYTVQVTDLYTDLYGKK